jgi:hypothetical protein
MPELIPVSTLPWQPQSTITGNLAVGNLRNTLERGLTVNGRIHAETLFVALGALVGFAAQNAALEAAATATHFHVTVPEHSLVIATTKHNERLFYGDWINLHLVNEGASKFPLDGFLSAYLIQAGVAASDLPNYTEMFCHVTETVGNVDFGTVRAPEGHESHNTPAEALKLLWLFCRGILQLPLDRQIKNCTFKEPPLKDSHWPVVLSYVTTQFFKFAKDVLDPRIAYALTMESAIIASKTDPDFVEPGKWKIDSSSGKLVVERLKH